MDSFGWGSVLTVWGKDRQTGKFIHYNQMPDFMSYEGISTVMSIMQPPTTGHIGLVCTMEEPTNLISKPLSASV